MPYKTHVVKVNTAVGRLKVAGRLEVAGPFYGGSSGRPEDPALTLKGQSLAARIERAVNSAILNFSADIMDNEPVYKG